MQRHRQNPTRLRGARQLQGAEEFREHLPSAACVRYYTARAAQQRLSSVMSTPQDAQDPCGTLACLQQEI